VRVAGDVPLEIVSVLLLNCCVDTDFGTSWQLLCRLCCEFFVLFGFYDVVCVVLLFFLVCAVRVVSHTHAHTHTHTHTRTRTHTHTHTHTHKVLTMFNYRR